MGYVLGSTSLAWNGIDEVIEVTGKSLWDDVFAFGGIADNGSAMVTEGTVPAVATGAKLGGIKGCGWFRGVGIVSQFGGD